MTADLVLRPLGMAFAMGWEILWPLILGFTLSGIVQAVVSHQQMSRLLRTGSGSRSSWWITTIAKIWGPIIGPLVAVIAFVCSVGTFRLPLCSVGEP